MDFVNKESVIERDGERNEYAHEVGENPPDFQHCDLDAKPSNSGGDRPEEPEPFDTDELSLVRAEEGAHAEMQELLNTMAEEHRAMSNANEMILSKLTAACNMAAQNEQVRRQKLEHVNSLLNHYVGKYYTEDTEGAAHTPYAEDAEDKEDTDTE